MKKVFKKLCCVVLVLSLLAFCGCSKNAESKKSGKIDKKISLKSACSFDSINLDSPYIEIGIYSGEDYHFTNRNTEFFNEFITFFENKSVTVRKTNTDDFKEFYITFYDGENSISLSIYQNDIITIRDKADSYYYYCADIYREFKTAFTPFLQENSQFCRSASTAVAFKNEYAIYDKDHNILESDYISRTPYLFYRDEIVHLWVQSGTGTLTRSAKFFDVEKGLISPEYYGQTDYFGELVISTSSSQIFIFKMFSGEELYCFDQFEEPLGDCTENIQSAYFTEDGTKIVVKYFNADFETRTQIFTIPQSITG